MGSPLEHVAAGACRNGQSLVEQTAALQLAQPNNEAQELPALHVEHSNTQRERDNRTEPSQFGSRYLTDEDDVFQYNAWDHVETDDAFKQYAEEQYEMQRQSPVSEFDKSEYFLALQPVARREVSCRCYVMIPILRIVQLSLCDETCNFSLSLPSDAPNLSFFLYSSRGHRL